MSVKNDNQDSYSIWPTNLYERFMASNIKSKAYYERLLKAATSYDEWSEVAAILDDIDGLDKWKKELKSTDYDWELVKARLDQLKEIRRSNKGQSAMVFALRTSLARNLGDMGNSKLYSYSRVGTKKLTSDYIDQVVRHMNWICDEPADKDEKLDLKQKYDFFINIRQSFGRTALLLSGGGTLGLNHAGVIQCLYENCLLPRIISGASSGSIVASIVCTKTAEELVHFFDTSLLKLDVFERHGEPDTPLYRIQRLIMKGQLFDVEILKEAMRENLGDITFQEAFNRTRFILNITVSSSTLYDMPRLLNYITTPDVIIWSAVAASCAVPIIYGSSPLYSKNKDGKIVPWNPSDQLYIDGSVENDLPMNKLSELFNVNHFIVCQVNPHVIPFLQKANTSSRFRQAANFCMHMAKTEVQHRCTQLTELGILPSIFNKIQSIMSQKYSGDVTIIPEIDYSDFLRVLSNPTPDYFLECIRRGQQATWPKMSIIKNHLQIEMAIDQILYRLRLLRLEEIKESNNLINAHQSDSKNRKKRPSLKSRSTTSTTSTTSKLLEMSIFEDDTAPQKVSEMTAQLRDTTATIDSQSTPMLVVPSLSEKEAGFEKEVKKKIELRRERDSTKRGLLMTKPE